MKLTNSDKIVLLVLLFFFVIGIALACITPQEGGEWLMIGCLAIAALVVYKAKTDRIGK